MDQFLNFALESPNTKSKNGLILIALSRFIYRRKVKRNTVTLLITNNQMNLFTFLQKFDVSYFQQ